MPLPLPRFNGFAIFLHWLIAAGLVGQFALGWWMVSLPDEPRGVQAPWYNLHKSVGMLLGLFILVRLAWRLANVPPAQYRSVPHAIGWIAELSHSFVYAFLVLVPLSGFLGSTFSGDPIRFLGVTLAGWGWNDPALKSLFGGIHYVAVWILMALIVLHVSAALWHLARRDGAFWRIFPRGAS